MTCRGFTLPGREVEIAQYCRTRAHADTRLDWLAIARKQGWQSQDDPVLCAVFDVGMSPAMLYRIEWREDNGC